VIDAQPVLAVIPARGGSKGLPGKNIRPAGGKPLIAWTIEAARGARLVDRVVLSSDDAAIIAVAREWGCEAPFVREARLAGDETPTIEVVLDALARLPGYPWVVLLQPTSPLRLAADIDGAIGRCVAAGAPSCVSVCEARENPWWMYRLGEDGRLAPLIAGAAPTRRQDLPRVVVPNGAVYVARADWLARERKFITTDTVAWEMPAERSLDIDTESDLIQLQAHLGDKRDVPLSPTP
jgi:N-acylneuraminate cytidylyltransferase